MLCVVALGQRLYIELAMQRLLWELHHYAGAVACSLEAVLPPIEARVCVARCDRDDLFKLVLVSRTASWFRNSATHTKSSVLDALARRSPASRMTRERREDVENAREDGEEHKDLVSEER